MIQNAKKLIEKNLTCLIYKKLYENSQVDLCKYKKLYNETYTELIKYKKLSENSIVEDEEPILIKKKNPYNLLQKIVKNEYKNQAQKNLWDNTNFELVNLLKNDYSGRVGEKYIHELCNNINILNVYNNDKICKGGTYDIIIKDKKIEIKTARYGLSESFQHESLRNKSSDYYLFVDIKPSYFYITIIPSFDLAQKCKIIERKPHLRKGTTDVYKFDFSEINLKKSTLKGFSIKIEENTPFGDINNFIAKRII